MPEYAWHVHHRKLYEELYEPIGNRIDYVKSSKNQSEVATRLKLLRKVKDQKAMAKIVAGEGAIAKAWEGYYGALDQVVAAYRPREAKAADKEKADDKASTAVAAAVKLQADHDRAINALHAKECEPDCPWNGKTIFPANAY